MPDLPQIPPDELARRLDRGDRVQVLDIRAPEKVARGRVAFGAALDFKALPGSRLYQLPTLDALGLEAALRDLESCNRLQRWPAPMKQAFLSLRSRRPLSTISELPNASYRAARASIA